MQHTDRVRSRVPDGTLIRGLYSAVYLVEQGKKRPISDMATFHSYGFTAKSMVELNESVLEEMETGSPVNISGDFILNSPSTLLVKQRIGNLSVERSASPSDYFPRNVSQAPF